MREVGRDHEIYVTASDIRDQDGYGDVTPGLLRTWIDEQRLAIVTCGELAAAFGRQLPAGVDPAAPARAPGRSGPENVYRWSAIVRAETSTRRRRQQYGGLPRGRQARPVRRVAMA